MVQVVDATIAGFAPLQSVRSVLNVIPSLYLILTL